MMQEACSAGAHPKAVRCLRPVSPTSRQPHRVRGLNADAVDAVGVGGDEDDAAAIVAGDRPPHMVICRPPAAARDADILQQLAG